MCAKAVKEIVCVRRTDRERERERERESERRGARNP